MDRLTGRKLMVVAHPDDETLWGGGLVLRYPGDWTIVACSVPVSDPIRAEKFHDACARLGAKGKVLQYPDQFGVPLDSLHMLDLTADVIVTHGLAGEYGHPHHEQVSHYVHTRAACPVISFGYLTGKDVITLTRMERAAKLHALKAYDHVLPYGGQMMTKWAALLTRYGAGWLERESYD